MPILTIEALRENPWCVIAYELPPDPTRLLLRAASLAAIYCRDSEYLFVLAAREGDFTPTWWNGTDVTPDAHEESENLCHLAWEKLYDICDLLGETVDEPTGSMIKDLWNEMSWMAKYVKCKWLRWR